MKPILLWGPMGVGKTAIGRALAARLGLPFTDLDDAVEVRAHATVARIFAERGEPKFRELEAEALRALLTHAEPRVIALGGGSLVDPVSCALALDGAIVVSLHAPVEILLARCEESARDRPLLGSDPRAKLAALLEARREAYRVGHLRLDASGSLDALVDELASRLSVAPSTIVARRTIAYAVEVARARAPSTVAAVARELAPTKVFVVSDTTVAALHAKPLLEALRAALSCPVTAVTLEPGEAHKTMGTVTSVLEALQSEKADRSSLLVGLGGGVVTDVTGFAASLFARGVSWIAVPTTLLGMVDAAIGGKTGVNLGMAKNGVGTFHHPRAVIVDPTYAATQARRDFESGLSEAIKSGCVGDAHLFERIEAIGSASIDPLSAAFAEISARAIAVKAALVSADAEERGARALLNFGHTVGHALEAASGYGALTHGEAVAIGMVAEARAATELGLGPGGVADRIEAVLRARGLPVSAPAGMLERALDLLDLDKKRAGSSLKIIRLVALGRGELVELEVSRLRSALARTSSAG